MFGVMLVSGLAYTAYRFWGKQAPSLNDLTKYLPQPEVVMRNFHATFGPSPSAVKDLAERMLDSSKSQEMVEFCSDNEKDGFFLIRDELSSKEQEFIQEFIGNFLDIGDSETERQESPYFNQLYVCLCKDNKRALARVIDYFTFDEKILLDKNAYIVYRLKKEFLLENLKKDPELEAWKVIDVPKDGNCLLWACLVASGNEILHEQKMLAYRRQMAEIFREEIENNKALASRFDIHIQSHTELSKKVGTSEGRIDRYCALLEASGTWNDNFEAELLAKAMKKTIVILEGPDEKNLKVRDVAGIFCSEKFEDIIFVQYQNEHYKALVSDWLIVDRLD